MDGVHRGVHGPGVSVNGSPTQAIQVNIQHVAWFSNYKYNCCKKQKSYSLSFQAKKLMETPLCTIFQLFTHLLGKEDSKGATFMYNRSSWLFTRLPFEEKYKTMNRSGNEIKKTIFNQNMNIEAAAMYAKFCNILVHNSDFKMIF